jgi:hypothetical protein
LIDGDDVVYAALGNQLHAITVKDGKVLASKQLSNSLVGAFCGGIGDRGRLFISFGGPLVAVGL